MRQLCVQYAVPGIVNHGGNVMQKNIFVKNIISIGVPDVNTPHPIPGLVGASDGPGSD
jgi:hypothetical protein